ncbi:MAG: maltose alpha-D-glucosyltransferase [Anaerolineaceae bacterium]|nr:maltose alpha-D-glucosyltransferase [Anaerolineaceae bacterium]
MSLQTPWYKNAIFYEVNVRAYKDSNGDGHGDLQGLIQKLDYLKDLGVDCLWLMPIYHSPLKDDGYDISDYYNIQETFGDISDFKLLINEAHQRGIRIITDLVMNHTSDQHPWFQASRSSKDSPFRDYYVWSDDNTKYDLTRIIFLDTEESNWTFDEKTGQYYWHRFYSSQPDLNFDNPNVRQAMKDIMKFWLDMGIDGFRADAVPYLFEREGTINENLPETHTYLKEIRAYLDENYPDRILLAEANQWPKDVLAYFGDGDEFHMGFHFPIMPRIYMSLRKQDRESLVWIMRQTPDIPDNCQWCTFLRNHDELTLEMVTEEERQWMWKEYAPNPRMRLNLGIRRRLAPLLENNPNKIHLANAILFALPGTPIIYYGDEIGMGDNIWLDDRNGVRTPMQWDDSKNAGFSSANPENLYAPVIQDETFGYTKINVENQINNPLSLLNFMKKLIYLRKNNLTFSLGDFQWLNITDPAIVAFSRSYQNETMVAINNLSDQVKSVQTSLDGVNGKPLDLWSTMPLPNSEDGQINLTLQPNQFVWLKYTSSQ